jgi:hypothetical protein
MDAHGKRVELEHEMFPPGKDVLHSCSVKPIDAYPAIPADTGDALPDERPQLLCREMDGRAFHAAFSLQGLRPSGSIKLVFG